MASHFSKAKKTCDAEGPEQPKEETLKEKLDRVATEARSHEEEPKKEQPNPIVETVKQYVPGVEKILGGQKEEETDSTGKAPPPDGPPERPHHDMHIEEFLRDSHRSKRDDGLLEG